MKLLILITSFFAVYCRAQNQDANSPQPVKLLNRIRRQYEWYPQPLTHFAYGLFSEPLFQLHPLDPYINKPIAPYNQKLSNVNNDKTYLTNSIQSNQKLTMQQIEEVDEIKSSTERYQNKTPNVVISSPVEEINLSDVKKSNNSEIERLTSGNDILKEMSAKTAPYRAHPLFHYLKNKNTIDFNRVISFRNENSNENDTITLILKPSAKAIAGQDGKAIANPLARAILRQGTNVDVLFEPDAVAIAGPGGTAHAESDLEIHYEDI